jgi:hypothetical protein
MANKHRKVWKIIFQKLLFEKQTWHKHLTSFIFHYFSIKALCPTITDHDSRFWHLFFFQIIVEILLTFG